MWSETMIEIFRIFFKIKRGLSDGNMKYRKTVV